MSNLGNVFGQKQHERTQKLLIALAQKYELEDSKRDELIKYLLPFFQTVELVSFLQKILKFLFGLFILTGVVLLLIWSLVPEFFRFNLSLLNGEEKFLLVGIALSYSLSSFLFIYSFWVFNNLKGFRHRLSFDQELAILEKNLKPVIEDFVNKSA